MAEPEGRPPELPVAPVGPDEAHEAAQQASQARSATMLRGGVSLGAPFGVPVRVSLIGVVVSMIAADLWLGPDAKGVGVTPSARFWLAVGAGLLLEVSVLLHEIAHCVVARGLGLRVGGIKLFPLGGLTEVEAETRSPAREFLVAIAGPATSVLIGACAGVGWLLTRTPYSYGLGFSGAHDLLPPLLGWLAAINGLLAAFNLLPGLPLDGGRVLRAVVWRVTGRESVGTRAGGIGGYVVAAAAFVYAVGSSSRGTPFGSLFGVAVAAWIFMGARATVRGADVSARTPALSAGRLARRALLAAADLPLAEALRRARAVGATAVVVTERDGRPSGLMNGRAVDAMPESRRPWVPLSTVARPLTAGLVLDARLRGESVLDALRATPATEYLVVEPGGKVVGVLATIDVMATLDPRLAGRAAASAAAGP
jgi:Zn-dependent protease